MSAFQVSQNVRQSNMELLRIVAMFMIMVYHTVYNVFYDYRSESPIFASLMTILHIGVPLFVLISGYFGIKPSVKGFIKLYLILLFYNLLIYAVRILLNDIQFSFGEFLRLWLPFSLGRRYWFFKVYLMLYLIVPVINNIRDKDGGGKLLLITGVITFYWGWFAQFPSLDNGKNVVNFIFLYQLGFWLRKNIVEKFYDIYDTLKARRQYIIAYSAISMFVGSILYFSNEPMQNAIKRLCYGYNSPVLILMSVLFFMIFTTFEFKSKFVNWVASSVFAVYCVHENHYFFRDAWYGFFEQQYQTNSSSFPWILIGTCLLLYVLCIIFDKIRDIIIQSIISPVESLVQKCMSYCGRQKKYFSEII